MPLRFIKNKLSKVIKLFKKEETTNTTKTSNGIYTVLAVVNDSTFDKSKLIPGISFYDDSCQRSMLDGLSEEKQSIFKEIVNEQFFERGIKMKPNYQVYNTETKELLDV